MPDVDCVVRKHSKCQAGIPSFVDIMAQIGVVEGRCGAKPCTPHPVLAAVMSLLPLAAISESVLFIGTEFSILYTSRYSPAEAATPRAGGSNSTIWLI
jgi:hypothetical protein